jgi:chromosome segregation ATPase
LFLSQTRELEDAVEDLTAQLQETAAARRELEHQFRQAKRKWEKRRAELETLRSGVEEGQARWSEAQASVERELRETQARLQTARLETRASEEGRRSAEGEAAQGRRDLEAMESRARRLEVHKQEAEEALEAEREKHAIRVAELVEEKERGAQHCQLLLGRLGDEESKRQAATVDLVSIARQASLTWQKMVHWFCLSGFVREAILADNPLSAVPPPPQSTAQEKLTAISSKLEEVQRQLKSQEGQVRCSLQACCFCRFLPPFLLPSLITLQPVAASSRG